MQRILAPFLKNTTGPYQNMEKPDGGMAPNMTGGTLVGIKPIRATGPAGSLPKNNVGAGGINVANHLTLDTEYLGPAPMRPVSPVSPASDLAPEVSPVSSASRRSNSVPPQQNFTASNTPGSHRVISMTGSEARIVSIPPRSSRTLTGGTPPGLSRGVRPPGSSRDLVYGKPPGSSRNPTGGGSDGRAWRPLRQETSGLKDLRPLPLSINRSRQLPVWSQTAPYSAGEVNNAGYKPYYPSMARQPMQRVSQGSVSDASIASSDAFSLTDAISWPKPPRTPTASPDRH